MIADVCHPKKSYPEAKVGATDQISPILTNPINFSANLHHTHILRTLIKPFERFSLRRTSFKHRNFSNFLYRTVLLHHRDSLTLTPFFPAFTSAPQRSVRWPGRRMSREAIDILNGISTPATDGGLLLGSENTCCRTIPRRYSRLPCGGKGRNENNKSLHQLQFLGWDGVAVGGWPRALGVGADVFVFWLFQSPSSKTEAR